MLKRILLAALLLASTSCTSLPSQEASLEAQAWYDACDLSRYDCFAVKRPDVLVSVMAGRLGAHGFYIPGMETVYLSPEMDLNQVRDYAVLAHEYIHYLQDLQGDFVSRGGDLTSCLIEEEAFQVYDKVVEKYGRPDLKRPTWYLGYPC